MRNLSKWLGGCGLMALGWAVAQLAPATDVHAQTGKASPQPVVAAPDKKDVLAYVNDVPITRQELGDELIARFGKHQLELLINRRIIQMEAQRVGVTATDEEVRSDLLDVMALGKFRNEREFEEHFLKKEKNCTLYEYKEDVVRPGILMKKLAGKRVEVTEDEIKKAFDAKFGEKVQVRIIFVERDQRLAISVYEEIIRSEQGIERTFNEAAKRQANPQLAATGGQVNPVGRGVTHDAVEQAAFAMRDGELSRVLQVPGGFIIMLRDKLLPPDAKQNYAEERETLRLEMLERKMRAEVPKIFKDLKLRTKVQDYLNNKHSDGFIGAIEQQRQENGQGKNP